MGSYRWLLVGVVVLVLAGCGPSPAPVEDGWISPLPTVAKGYELYSWRADGRGPWHYVLITGTNRQKTYEEITASPNTEGQADWVKLHADSLQDLKAILRRLAPGETVIWMPEGWLADSPESVDAIWLPAQDVIAEIEAYCQQFGIQLSVAGQPPAGPQAAPTLTTPVDEATAGSIRPDTADRVVELGRWGRGPVRAISYSPDGREIAFVTSLGVYVHDAQTLDLSRFFAAGSDWYSVAFSPDGSLLAWASEEGVDLLRVADGRLVRTLQAPSGRPASPDFSPDGTLLAAIVFPPGDEVYTGEVVLWQVADGAVARRWDAEAAHLAFAPDGTTLASWHTMTGIRLWQMPDGEPLGTLDGWVDDVAFASSAGVMAASGMGRVRLWHGADWSFVRSIDVPGGTLGAIALSPDGTMLAAGTAGGVQVWQVATAGPPTLLGSRSGMPVRALAFSPTGDVVAWAGTSVVLAQVSDGAVLRALDGYLPPVRRAVPSPAGSTLAVIVDAPLPDIPNVYLWEFSQGATRSLPEAGAALSAAYSPDGSLLAVGGWDGHVRLVDGMSGRLLRSIAAHPAQVQSVALAPDGELVASSAMGEVRVWQVGDGALVRVLAPSGAGWMESVAFSPDGSLLAAVWSGRVWLWRVADWTLVHALVTEDDGYSSRVAFAPDGSAVALAKKDQVLIWRLPDAEFLLALDLATIGEACVAYSPDGSLLTAGAGSEIQVWRVSDGSLLHTLAGPNSTVTDVAFLPGGQRIVSASWDGTVRLWGMAEPAPR